ncbi:hypothetical protein AMR72_18115 [Flavobacterium psychrophilum]|nr:hypothetical protein AMR72_18115 [Flavobacterium psychrophilum]AOE54246.1 hypothetical protein ALW18_18100 [Flavobacterium psychrophilum]
MVTQKHKKRLIVKSASVDYLEDLLFISAFNEFKYTYNGNSVPESGKSIKNNFPSDLFKYKYTPIPKTRSQIIINPNTTPLNNSLLLINLSVLNSDM